MRAIRFAGKVIKNGAISLFIGLWYLLEKFIKFALKVIILGATIIASIGFAINLNEAGHFVYALLAVIMPVLIVKKLLEYW